MHQTTHSTCRRYTQSTIRFQSSRPLEKCSDRTGKRMSTQIIVDIFSSQKRYFVPIEIHSRMMKSIYHACDRIFVTSIYHSPHIYKHSSYFTPNSIQIWTLNVTPSYKTTATNQRQNKKLKTRTHTHTQSEILFGLYSSCRKQNLKYRLTQTITVNYSICSQISRTKRNCVASHFFVLYFCIVSFVHIHFVSDYIVISV